MRSLIIVALFVAAASAAPLTPDGDAQIVRYDAENIGTGLYSFLYETSNGIGASEQGSLKNAGTENESIAVTGQFFYTGTDGVVYRVSYTADENGFQPSGEHIPA